MTLLAASATEAQTPKELAYRQASGVQTSLPQTSPNERSNSDDGDVMMMMEVVVRSNPFDISPCTIPSPAHFRAPWIQRPCACAARFAASGQVALGDDDNDDDDADDRTGQDRSGRTCTTGHYHHIPVVGGACFAFSCPRLDEPYHVNVGPAIGCASLAPARDGLVAFYGLELSTMIEA